MRKQYTERGKTPLWALLPDAPRDGRPITVDSRIEAQIALAARWTLQMIADKLVQLQIIESISHERVRLALKKTA